MVQQLVEAVFSQGDFRLPVLGAPNRGAGEGMLIANKNRRNMEKLEIKLPDGIIKKTIS